ncbi:MAG: deoxyribodipyrimidine photo-lyase [Pseudomonadota bacterium]
MNAPPVLVWLRRDLRLSDHPAFAAAAKSGAPIIPLFIRDASVDGLAAAPKWRLERGLAAFAPALEERGSRLVLRSGPALAVLRAVLAETGAGAVHWSRAYDPASIARDTEVKTALKADGIDAQSHPGHVLFEPWTVATKTGGFFKVYTPMWNAVKGRDVAAPEAPPALAPPGAWPASEDLESWHLGRAMNRGAAVVSRHVAVGEAAARDRLDHFIADLVAGYDRARDMVAEDGTSRLSAHLSLGEIGPRTCWHAGLRARDEGRAGAETFLKELVWREFAYHLLYHTPHIAEDNWREEWSAFPWNEDEDRPNVIAWKQGRTGLPFVDAAMREMYVTGTMHNRGRMIVASYLTKHLMTHWKVGLRWFEEHLVDWDPASNAMGWQWSAGSGPDATPYFRVFNPETQLDKFDRARTYTGRWIAETSANPTADALSYFDAIPRSWGLAPTDPYPDPIVTPAEGRKRALDAYQSRGF